MFRAAEFGVSLGQEHGKNGIEFEKSVEERLLTSTLHLVSPEVSKFLLRGMDIHDSDAAVLQYGRISSSAASQ